MVGLFCITKTAQFTVKVEKGGVKVGIFEYLDSKIPDYYPTMYRDGYSPEQILHAARRKILKEYEARKEAQRAEAEANEIPEVRITSKVVVK